MKQLKRSSVANRFNELYFHDDYLISIIIRPSTGTKNRTGIDFVFRDYSTEKKKLLSFIDCANLRYLMDFDVLVDNWFAQTDASNAKIDVDQMKKFVLAQKPHWHTRYMPPTPSDKPIKKKLSAIRNYVLFRVTFFGGTAEILAKGFRFTRSR